MEPNFEIKYIEIQWYDRQTITKITESLNSLSIEFNYELRCFESETTIYPQTDGLRGQLAIRFLINNSASPYIELPNGAIQHLTKIEDTATKKEWWIVKDSWDESNKYWRHTGINTAGTLKLIFDQQKCQILIGSMDFSREQLEDYLSEFKNELWELILDDSSAIHANKPGSYIGVNKEIIDSIQHIVTHAENILKNPKVELREIQALKPRKFVKPVSRTFMEIVSKTDQKNLTSRATAHSYNVSENRYILFALEQSYKIIKQITILSENKQKRYEGKSLILRKQHDSFSDFIAVDRDLMVKDFKSIKEKLRISYWQDRLSEALKSNNVNFRNKRNESEPWYIRTTGYTVNQKTNQRDGFFIEVYDYHRNGEWTKVDGKWTILRPPEYLSNFVNCLDIDIDYKIVADLNFKTLEKVVHCDFTVLTLIEVFSIQKIEEKLSPAFEIEKRKGLYLSKNGWKRKINENERMEQEREKLALQNRMKYFSKNEQISREIFHAVEPKQRQLLKIIKTFRQLNIKSSSSFPNSMTFVQNPHYQGVHNAFKILKRATNLADDDLLISLEEIDASGLVNMPLIYERWCLLQIISVLINSFRFTPKDNWKYNLINAIKSDGRNVKMHFSNYDAKRNILLTYEKTLDNGKRPDFVIDLDWFKEDDVENKSPIRKRFVLDAKFYDKATFEKFGGLMGVVDLLRIKKGYREATDNPVFIIHPCKTALPERVTAQEWGKYSFLGELPIENSHSINHQYGGIFLSPIDKQLFADELQRLLGLFLQYKLESPIAKKYLRDSTQSKPFCISCGSTNIREIERSNQVYRTPHSVWMQCNDCQQFIAYNHCRNTGTRLIKNGFYWTYHSVKANDPFNIKCPSCGEWGAW